MCLDKRKGVNHLKGWPRPCRSPSVCQLLPNDDEEEDPATTAGSDGDFD